ncbi:hypothetical protein [Nocardia sp. NPDC024068]|uniref:hypothetical protein n=1 Tax=Nocardia sp. NPDC024068 TaxID=3157197 RepID=UPI003408EA48
MTIHITYWLMTSGISPEFAERVQTRHGSSWQLSWLPGRALSYEQAYAGMEIDQILSAPELVEDPAAMAYAARQVDLLGLLWDQVVYLLAKRVEARQLEARFLDERGPGPVPSREDPGAIRSGSAA